MKFPATSDPSSCFNDYFTQELNKKEMHSMSATASIYLQDNFSTLKIDLNVKKKKKGSTQPLSQSNIA
jgi:hypothetical protein